MSIVKIVVFLVIAALLIGGGIFYNRRLDDRTKQEALTAAQNAEAEQARILASLQKEDVVVGTGAEAKSGDVVTVNYIGTLENGQKFESSYDRKAPFTFTLGVGRVIRGWDLGIVGMKVGGKRNLVIPPELAYGGREVGPIPANSTLKFVVELLSVKAQ